MRARAPPASPAALADPDAARSMLTEAGFVDIEFDSIEEPMSFGSDADDAYAFVGGIGIVKGSRPTSTRQPEPKATAS
jgi:hypothetical protein